jgi:hypothetical protein
MAQIFLAKMFGNGAALQLEAGKRRYDIPAMSIVKMRPSAQAQGDPYLGNASNCFIIMAHVSD